MLNYHRALRIAEGVDDPDLKRWLIQAITLKHESEVLRPSDPLEAVLHTLARFLSQRRSLDDVRDHTLPLFFDDVREGWYLRSPVLLEQWDAIFGGLNPHVKPSIADYDLVLEVLGCDPSEGIERDGVQFRVRKVHGQDLKVFINSYGVRLNPEIMRTL